MLIHAAEHCCFLFMCRCHSAAHSESSLSLSECLSFRSMLSIAGFVFVLYLPALVFFFLLSTFLLFFSPFPAIFSYSVCFALNNRERNGFAFYSYPPVTSSISLPLDFIHRKSVAVTYYCFYFVLSK